ncbi:MAG: hypothetical protein AUK63_1930 [bacterium P3]|nr:MAG: hypothetical protein AUK63_1930 [bacterium P3]KWW35699.1 MAG: hypothetical protein F083_2417 [bacterium F083]
MKKFLLMATAATMLTLSVNAQPGGGRPQMEKKQKSEKNDSIVVTEHKEERNVMANAEYMDRPRDLDAGLGSGSTPTVQFGDGLPVSYTTFPIYSHQHWKPGASQERMRMLGLAESGIRAGAPCYVQDTYAWKGSKKFEGKFNIRLNNQGHQTYEGGLGLPLGAGWSTAIHIYEDYNKGFNDVKITPMQGRTQMLQWGITKDFRNGQFWALYKYTDDFQNMDMNAPALYHIDGSVELMEGFKIGRDTYMPDDDRMTYLDVATGEKKSVNFGSLGSAYVNEFQAGLTLNLKNNLTFSAVLKYLHGSTSKTMNNLATQGDANENSGFTYTDGSLFTGRYQTRNIKFESGTINDITSTFELRKKTKKYEWIIGLNEWHNHLDFIGSSSIIAQECAVNPRRLYKDGEDSWSYNLMGEYTKGDENRLALYWIHNMHLTDRWDFNYGLRLEDKAISVHAPFNVDGDNSNSRKPGFSLKSQGAHIVDKTYNFFVPSAIFYTGYRINNHLLAAVDAAMIRGRASLHQWGNGNEPRLDPAEIIIASAGISYKNHWMDWASKISIMRKNNELANTMFAKNFDGVAAQAAAQVNYDLQSTAWVNDINIYPFKGFNMHFRLMLQKPEYKSYDCEVTYDNGVTEQYSFSGKNIKNLNQVLMEIDPSYSFGKFRVSATVRYTGKSYINLTNTLTMNPIWDTFANIDYRMNKYVSFNLNIINLLNTAGIAGRINGADTADEEQAKSFDGQFMAGSFRIPRTFNFTTRIHF